MSTSTDRRLVRRVGPDEFPRPSRDGGIPLSFAQQRLWFLEQLLPSRGVYHIPGLFELHGSLDVAALRRSLTELLARHESLRTAFGEVAGQPVQMVRPAGEVTVQLACRDLREVPEPDRTRLVERLAAEQASRPFDLGTAPLWRAGLLRIGDDRHVLLLTLHHIVADGWSVPVLVEELAELYPAFVEDRPVSLPPLPVQYSDFAVWQREWLSGERLSALLAYWQERLREVPTLGLSTDRPRPPQASYRGDAVPIMVPSDDTATLRTLARQCRATPFMVLLAAFVALLHRYTGQDDLVVGSPVANRTLRQLHGVVGFFANTLVLRCDAAGDPTFLELLTRVRRTVLDALDHQDMPFERLVAELDPQRSLSSHPLFQVHFMLAGLPQPRQAGELRIVRPPAVRTATAKFDLSVLLYDEPDTVAGVLEYASDLFDRATMQRMTGHYLTLLRSAVRAPQTPLSQLALLTDDERAALLAGSPRRLEAAPPGGPNGLFEAQAARTPTATAVITQTGMVSYGELDAMANRLANHLRERGVRPEVLVGICSDDPLENMVAVLAVLKAGGGYVALDPSYPARRLALIVDDARIPVLITSSSLVGTLPATAARTVLLDAERDAIARRPATDPAAGAHSDNLAYVVYTSGSTGRPKGVAMTRRALASLVGWHNSGHLTGGRTLQFAALGFDMSIYEMLVTWASGGTVVSPVAADRRDLDRLAAVLIDHGVQKAMLPVPVLQQLAELFQQDGRYPQRLAEVITAGEQLVITRPVRQLFRRLPGARLHNHYGPSEAHVVTAHALPGDPDHWPEYAPIGRPADDVRLYLLDQYLQPVPVGVPGEVYLGGIRLARGYLHRPDRTAERFVPDPFGEPGERLYRTGDLARYRAGGDLEFLGRLDQQVKIRGHRVEPAEIEAALAGHPAVRQTAVIVRADATGRPMLVGYVAGAPGLRAEELRAHLRARLPDYLVPGAFVVLDELPLDANRKLDRSRLPAATGPDLAADQAPRTGTERTLAGIWADVLRLERVGAQANFFDLGGHSLLATQITSRIRDVFGIGLTVGVLFEHPTVAELAAVVDRRVAGERAAHEPIPRVDRTAGAVRQGGAGDG